MRPRLKLAMLVIAVGLVWVAGAFAQLGPPNLPPAGFTETGFIQEATLNPRVGATTPSSPRLYGGNLTVNGIKMIVPNNTIVQMPAAAFTWADLFNPAFSASVGYNPPRPNHGAGVTGLALVDNLVNPLQGTRAGAVFGSATGSGPFPSYEVTVTGNIVYDGAGPNTQKYIVALIVPVTQQGFNSGSGIVNFIDYVAGRFRVGGIIGNATSGTLCEINDPIIATPLVGLNSAQTGDGDGRFGKRHSPDPRFSADTNNPTICTSTGYPAGLPRVQPTGLVGDIGDPTRPYTNRPHNPPLGLGTADQPHDPFLAVGAPLKTFVMPAVGSVGVGTPDPRLQVPIMVGDFVTYSGTLFKLNPLGPNTAANAFVSVHTMEVDLGVYTQPSTKPVYVKCDVALIGTDGFVNPADPPIIVGGVALPGEFARRATFEGFCTDAGNITLAQVLNGTAATYGSATVTANAVNVSNTGVESLTVVPNEPSASVRGNPASVEGNPFGRYVCRTSKLVPVVAVPLTREYRVVHSNGVYVDGGGNPIPVCNGLIAGQFQLPMFDFITPEHTVQGSPQYPGNYQDLGFLVTGNVAGGTPMGPLDPWPGRLPSNQPAAL